MTNTLFSPLKVGAITVPNRIFMAPLTRSRAGEAHLPNALMAEYYAQRASGGLLIAECTMIQPGISAFWHEPGIYSQAQIDGWKLVTEAVHKAGGRIFLQIWHAGRATHPDLNGGAQPVAPSAIAIQGDTHTQNGKVPYVTPRELRDDEIPGIVAAFRQAALNAVAAGFDGVEIHGANGYLIDQFLRDGSNKRTGPYGGPRENRARLLFEVLDACCKAIGSDRVGLRLSPLNNVNGMSDSDPVGLMTWLAGELNRFNLAFLHLIRVDFTGQAKGDLLTPTRAAYKGVLVSNAGYNGAEADEAIQSGKVDAVAFGSSYIANPDLPERLKANAPLNAPNPKTFYGVFGFRDEGYTDYPRLAA
jgi:N-ethylmaleimide reductase